MYNAYREKNGEKPIVSQSFYRMINDNNMRYHQLCDVMQSIGYEITFQKKED